MTKIIVHDGKAHQDDFLAACVCAFKLNAPVFRTKFTQENLEDPNCWVLDQGARFDPELHNFDHHQIEKEICAFTMVLDFLYGEEYRTFQPNLRYVEIFDSYGPSAAAKFAQIPESSIDIINCPIRMAIMQVFSRIDGEVTDSLLYVMREIGREICFQIENTKSLFEILSDGKLIEFEGYKIFNVCDCVMIDGTKHDRLPTKEYCKHKGYEPEIILTKDSRTQNGYRMVSINTDNLRFTPNDLCYFTHNSGFLTNFKNFEDYKVILKEFTKCAKK